MSPRLSASSWPPVWIAPVMTIAAILVFWIFLLIVMSGVAVSQDLGSVTRLWTQSGIFFGLLQHVVGYLIQGLWALPIYSWLVLVSSTARKLPLVWAVLLPIVPIILELLFLRTQYIRDWILQHLSFAALPMFSNNDGQRNMPVVETLSDQMSLLVTADLWLGVLIGVVILAGAVKLRQRNNEI